MSKESDSAEQRVGCTYLVGLAMFVLAFVPSWAGWFRALLGIIGGLIVFGLPIKLTKKQNKKHRKEQRLQREIVLTVEKHGSTLRRKRRQLLRVDDYGNTFTDGWDREVDYFLANVITPLTGNPGLHISEAEFARQVIDRVSQEQSDSEDAPDISSMDPIEYEHYCADLLRDAGWDAIVTTASGDQGVDISATRDGRTLVVQAKRYSGSVGNAAVQEAIAGKQFLNADLAAVVSPAPFTKSAKELANVTGVLLLHHDELGEL